MGNLRSVLNALQHIGQEVRLVNRPEDMDRGARIILPGVGAYAKAMENLKSRGFDGVLQERVREGSPLLGICLGMQLLSTRGFEPVESQGLGLIDGEVRELEVPEGYPLPHVGWNNLVIHRPHPVFEGVKTSVDFYFVHSYHFVATDDQHVLATSEYGCQFTSAVARDNIVALQFHPEKSQDNGLKLLENFCAWDGRC